ncbi:MAG: hypothetical protein R3283_07775 [Balneolaceae bacterium]|nr:hypothetical protein [Balneolaceae bacterium]
MKHAIIGSFAGIAIVFALDSFARVIIATYSGIEILMFSYADYPGLIWPVSLTIFAGLSSFIGGLFSITYGRSHKGLTATLYLLMLIFFRYGQIHLLLTTESLFYPITALVLSLGGVFFAWQLLRDKSSSKAAGKVSKTEEDEPHYHEPESQKDNPANFDSKTEYQQ